MYAEEEDDVGDDRNQNVFSCDFHWLIPPPFRSADYTRNERGAWLPDEAFRPLRPGLMVCSGLAAGRRQSRANPSLNPKFPVMQGKYREFHRFKASVALILGR